MARVECQSEWIQIHGQMMQSIDVSEWPLLFGHVDQSPFVCLIVKQIFGIPFFTCSSTGMECTAQRVCLYVNVTVTASPGCKFAAFGEI